MSGRYRDLSPVWWRGLTLVPAGLLLALGLFSMTDFENLTYKEGPVEWLTVLVCLTGAITSIVVFCRRKAFPSAWMAVIPVVFFFGFIYMGGEECSWGKHIVNLRMPGDPEEIKNQGLPNIDQREQNNLTEEQIQAVKAKLNWWERLNDQSETNLHNFPGFWGDLFGKLPKQIVEFGSVIACIIIPFFFRKKLNLDDPHDINYWLFPTKVCALATAIAFVLPFPKRIVELFVGKAPTTLRLSEPQELYLAIVLALYIASLAVRLKQHRQALRVEHHNDIAQPPAEA